MYEFSFEVTLREDHSGGQVRKRPVGSEAAFWARDRLVLLVHGYNVASQSAFEQCGRFAEWLVWYSRALGPDIGLLEWPGDKWWIGRQAFYPLLVGNAKKSGEGLAEFLRSRTGPAGLPCDIVLIGHSLGCRVILEALRALSQAEPDASLRNRIIVVLLAPAVSVQRVDTGGALNSSLSRATSGICVFYSPSDLVLAAAFPAGQLLAEGEPIAEAVGRHGNPQYLWKDAFQAAGFGHGDYWASRDIAGCVAFLLGAAVTRPLFGRSDVVRSVLSRPDPPSRLGPPPRKM